MSTEITLVDPGRDWEAIQRLIANTPGSTLGSLTSIEKECSNNSECYVTKVVDTIADAIVGISVWFIYTSQKHPGCWTGPTTHPHVYLYLISTRALEEDNHSAESLMQWGLDRADSMGLEVWTYSSSPENSLYCANGFTKVEEILTESQSVWSMKRTVIANRRVHREAYNSSHGFW
ncbi:hypothetical protein PMIN06_007451 [Paraphaeosphaeria minitans]|uniref:N-acetyltransferase domain-containing protein n=1 Tax=Paraphaeosphaeria minitans TaxID=565426 RepID=A0A9P6KN57_9PLEO|nr:hypothetical protein PMIN01_09259 [Paraphaeosphaeria minitans]